MTTPPHAGHARYETLLVKAVDGVIAEEERQELDAHLEQCPECAAELADFQLIKDTTDAMTSRILRDAQIEPVREGGGSRFVFVLSSLLLLAGALALLGFAGYSLAVDTDVPLIVKIGSAAIAAGCLGLLAYVLRIRKRAYGRDPYEEIDL